MKQEISQIILQELKDPRIGFVTVTKVEMTGDLREAKIFVSIMGKDEALKDTLRGLQSSIGFNRREIGRLIRLRFTPDNSFPLANYLAYSSHIQELLMGLNKNDKTEE